MTRDAVGSPRVADLLGPLLADTVSWTAQCPPPLIAATELGHPAGVVDRQLPTFGTQERPVGNRPQRRRYCVVCRWTAGSVASSVPIAEADKPKMSRYHPTWPGVASEGPP